MYKHSLFSELYIDSKHNLDLLRKKKREIMQLDYISGSGFNRYNF